MKKPLLCVLVLAVLVLSACSVEPPSPSAFTYREAIEQAPFCYSPLDWRTDTESAVLELTASPLYIAVVRDGSYAFQPEMAAEVPVDISAGLGLEPGTAWRIDLKPEIAWADGTPITASTFVSSARELLDPAAQHSRAGDLLFLQNAWAWYYGSEDPRPVYRSLADAGYLSAAEALTQGEMLYLDMTGFWELDCGWQRVDSEELFRDPAVEEGSQEEFVSPSYLYQTYLADGTLYDAYQTTFVGVARDPVARADWADVGIRAAGDHQLQLLTQSPVTAQELMQKLSRCFLIPETYDGAYGMDPADYLSCGPYILAEATAQGLNFTRNENWYGYTSGDHEGKYMATAVSWRVLNREDSEAAFDAGELDTLWVSQGEEARAIPQTYTSKLTFNTSLRSLQDRQREGVNKTLLANRDFRRAISACLDREAFSESCVPSALPALGLINDVFVTDVATGQRYRDTARGKAVLKAVYSAEDGYDPALAQALFISTWEDGIDQGLLKETDIVELEFLVYSDEAVYRDIVDFVQRSIDAAVKGTELEGRIRLLRSVDPGYYDAAKAGNFDMILSTWGGVPEDPYSILGCYLDREKSYEYGFDPHRESCTLVIDGMEQTRSYRAWYDLMTAERDGDRKLTLLAALEQAVLERFDCVPLYERQILFADGSRIKRTTEEAVIFAGFGGVRDVMFTVDDSGRGVILED